MKIGKAHRNVRSANRRCETCYMILKNLKIYPYLTLVVWACRGASERQYIGAGGSRCANILAQGGLGVPIYWRRGASERQYIGAGGPRCANILAHRCPSPPIGNDDQAQCANKMFFVWRRVNRCANSIGGL
jgi:hypothetical protein